MTLILSIETSTHHFSCALHQNDQLIAYKESISQQSTASQLALMIDQLFTENRVERNDLTAVVVASGPGSYTGLRIGVATAKGICYSLTIPLLSVNTLYLIAYQFARQFPDIETDSFLCPMLDARRMEVYYMLLNKELQVIEPTEAKVIDESSFTGELYQQKIYFFGEGSDKCKRVISNPSARFVSDIRPLASQLGILGLEKFLKNETEDILKFEPFYLKDFLIKKPNFIS